MKKTLEKKLNVAEMRTLNWILLKRERTGCKTIKTTKMEASKRLKRDVGKDM